MKGKLQYRFRWRRTSPQTVWKKKRIFIFMEFSCSWCFKAHAFELSTRKTIGCDNEKIRAYTKFFFRFDSFFLVNECSSLKIFLFLLIFCLSFFSLLLPSSSYTAASLRFLLIHSRKALSSFLIRMSENSSFCSALPLLLLLLFHTKNFIFFSFPYFSVEFFYVFILLIEILFFFSFFIISHGFFTLLLDSYATDEWCCCSKCVFWCGIYCSLGASLVSGFARFSINLDQFVIYFLKKIKKNKFQKYFKF